MSNKKARPEVFGDKHRRCLISSIAGYEATGKGGVNIHLKSGETVTLEFNKEYLQKLAMARLDGYFALDTPETDCCTVCVKKNVAHDDPGPHRKVFCDNCYSDRSNFESPEGKET